MELIKYRFLSCEIDRGTEEAPDIEQVFLSKTIECSAEAFDANYAIAQAEAHGEIIVENIPDPVTEPTPDERSRADIDYLAVMMGVEL